MGALKIRRLHQPGEEILMIRIAGLVQRLVKSVESLQVFPPLVRIQLGKGYHIEETVRIGGLLFFFYA
jgi:hypothetical protein